LEVKIRVLSYLYNRDEGANQHNIQFHSIFGHTQEAGRFKDLLGEMCQSGVIVSVDMSYVAKGRFIYKITDKGKKTIQSIQEPEIKEFLGIADQEI
jgi:hypothetical protein